jgi:hypothetical protein
VTDVAEVEQALAGLKVGYNADGYDLLVETVVDGVARVRIAPGPNACQECLVPKAIAEGTIRASLRGVTGISRVEVAYPRDTQGSA